MFIVNESSSYEGDQYYIMPIYSLYSKVGYGHNENGVVQNIIYACEILFYTYDGMSLGIDRGVSEGCAAFLDLISQL